MKVNHRTLATLERGYSVSIVPGAEGTGFGRVPGFLCGSEGEDALLLFQPPSFEPTVIARAPGGFISTAPFVSNGRVFAIAGTDFKPGFDAAESVLRLYPLDQGEMPESTVVASLPYTHRVALLPHGGRLLLLASTLCAGKANKEDWSQPGGIHLATAPDDLRAPWPVRQVVHGLRKNHGMDFALLGREQRPGHLLSSMEGLHFMPTPDDPTGAWPVELIDANETSDAFAFDWDGDGEPEIFSISPFHGHVLALHRKGTAGWVKTVIHDDLAMGHIVWAGDLLGAPALLAGSRRERRELRLYRPGPDGTVDPDYTLLDEGIGPTQIAVLPQGSRATLYVAAHGMNEVRLYELEA